MITKKFEHKGLNNRNTIEELEVGQKVAGIVKNIKPYEIGRAHV